MPRIGSTWTLWLAAALLVVGGATPFVFGGTSSRIDSVIIPFGIGAALFAAWALVPNLSRGLTALLYFAAGLAVVYGLLTLVALPVRLAVLGTCPAPPASCTTGLPRPLTDGENTGIGVAAALAILAIFVGFYALVMVYRRAVPAAATPPPPVRAVPPMAPPTPRKEPAGVAAHANPAADEPELPAPEELPELPPHES